MKYANRGLFYGFLSAMTIILGDADAAIRIGNAARSNPQNHRHASSEFYQQPINTAPTYAEPEPVELPIKVANSDVADQLRQTGQSGNVTVDSLGNCAMIYPNGEFEWARPTVGNGAGGASTCTAVVEMVALNGGRDGSDVIVARANLAAGDSVICNISAFPETAWLPDAEAVEFPADAEPTVDDVVAVMNEEQKQNAAIKIISGAVLGGLGGNITGKNDVGKDGLLGGGKDKIQNTIIGAVGGAGLMAASSYSGKVAGDMIMSGGINAAAGATIGNMAASGDSVLRIENCQVNGVSTTCLWGILVEAKTWPEAENQNVAAFYNVTDETVVQCDEKVKGEFTNCAPIDLIDIKLEAYANETNSAGTPLSLEEIGKQNFAKITDTHVFHKDDKGNMVLGTATGENNKYARISSASIPGKRQAALIADVQDSSFGLRKDDWTKLKSTIDDGRVYGRDNDGNAFKLETSDLVKVTNFREMYRDSGDGGIIDFGNKARLKATAIGAGVGAGLGAFTAYQGAQSDIEQRWVTEVRAYKDSLMKFVCRTGTRFLSSYNDTVIIPSGVN